MLGFYSEGRSLIQTSCPSLLVSPRKVPSVWHHTTIGEQTLQFRAAIGVWNGTVKWVSLELLYTKRTKASIWIFLELRPDRGFTFQSCLLCCRCSWGTWEEEPFFWESECRSMQLCEPFFFKVIAYDLSNKMFRVTDQQKIRSLRVDWKSRKKALSTRYMWKKVSALSLNKKNTHSYILWICSSEFSETANAK
jgi:hypothetical protein